MFKSKLFRLSGLVLILFSAFLMLRFVIPQNRTLTANDIEKQKENAWVEEKWNSMSENERLGQLYMVASYPNKGAVDELLVKEMIEKYHVGGLIMFQGGPTREAHLTNYYQSLSKKVPLLISVDGEWGLNMRMDSVIAFPRQILMGAIQDNTIIYDFGKEVARQCRRLGIHVNFAPVVDVNNNAANPVIGDRSFGENKENVTAKAFQYMKGMQDHNVMACAKHFPGHGDTDVDSHYDLPLMKHSTKRLDSLELFPFRNLIQHGIQSVMIAHLHIPALDPNANLPTTLSKPTVTYLLKDKMGFQGLTFTDAMMMQGVTKHFIDGDAELRALKAGIDIVLMPFDVHLAISKARQALKSGELKWEELEPRVKKVLRAKYRLGLHEYKAVSTQNVLSDINNADAHALYERLIESAITLTDNPDNLLPIRKIRGRKIATLSIGTGRKTAFQYELDKWGIENHFQAGTSITGANQTRLMNELKKQEIVLIGMHRMGRYPQTDFDLSPSARLFVNELSKHTKVVLTVFGSPYSLKFFENVTYVACTYVNDDAAERKAAQAIFGGLAYKGRLPVTASARFKYGMGVTTEPFRLGYAENPEDLGLNSKILRKIDDIANEAITKGATPGCQIMVIKDGKIAFHKTYGNTTYSNKRKVKPDDIYDLASVTKVAATTVSIMKLYEEGKIDIEQKLSFYLPELQGTNKENLIIRDILLHQAGLKAWIPFYIQTVDANKYPDPKHYRKKPDAEYCFRVAEGVYICKPKQDSLLWERIYNGDIDGGSAYKYSDLGFILFTRLIEKVSGKQLDSYVLETFYTPMGLENIMYNPVLNGIPKSRVVPTEEDKYFRQQMIHGDVHDMGAAMLGGVSGHAGLFAQASDLGAIFQMLMNGGVYQNRRYLKEETVKMFTAKYSKRSRRGLGFDRREGTNIATMASGNTFGHTGFTGIGAWADPDNKIIYLFLSNRTYPSGENMKLVTLNTRSRIHDVIYEAMMKPLQNLEERILDETE